MHTILAGGGWMSVPLAHSSGLIVTQPYTAGKEVLSFNIVQYILVTHYLIYAHN
jgi:hypothetical protein